MKKNIYMKIFFVKLVLFCIGIQVAFTHSEQKKSYSAVDCKGVPLDTKLMEIMNFENGVFVEVGAFDGVWSSNTKRFEEQANWSGILIEPSERLFSQLRLNRPKSKCFRCALGSFKEDDTVAYGDFDGHPMSSLTNRLNRPATDKVFVRSLQSILDECNVRHVNFFSLDTEGYELNVLNGIDFSKTVFDYILIEVYSRDYDSIKDLLAKKGYTLLYCLSNYNLQDNPGWDGTHNDYLFVNNSLIV